MRLSAKARLISAAVSLSFGVSWAPAADPNYTFRTLARTGQTEDHVTFGSYFQPGAITELGEVSFAPSLQNGGESIFLSNIFGLTKVRAYNDPLPGGGTFGYALGPIGMAPLGATAFISASPDVPLPLGSGSGVYRTVLGLPQPIPVMVPGVTRAPDGSLFQGAAFNAEINQRGEVVFPGIVCTSVASGAPSPDCGAGKKLAFGIYQSDLFGHIRAIVQPGTPAPGGNYFDYAQVPFLNNSGDVAFDAHVHGDPCTDVSQQQGFRIFCDESVYLKNGHTGAIVSIAHQGQASPVPGQTFTRAFGPVLNELGELVFIANLSGSGQNAVFLHSLGTTVTIAKPGDAMPGGGILQQAGGFPHNAYLNDNREVAFVGTLSNGGQGLYLWKNGRTSLVAKTGSTVDGGRVIANFDDFGAGAASSQIATNNRGQILFAANLTSGGAALLVATPH